MQIDPVFIAAIGSVITILGTMIGTTWRMRAELDRRDAVLTKMLTDHELADVVRFGEVKNEIGIASDRIRREFGETGHGLREKIRETEFWIRDNCVQIPVFDRAFDHLSEKLNILNAIEEMKKQ